MRHRAFPCHKPLRFAQAKTDVKAQLIINEIGVHNSRGGIGKLADVAPEEDRDLAAQHGDAGGFDSVHVDVDVADAAHAVHIPEAADAKELAVAVSRIVDETEELVDVCTDVCLDGRLTRELGGEFEGGGMDAAKFAVFVVVFPCHFLVGVWRGAQHEG